MVTQETKIRPAVGASIEVEIKYPAGHSYPEVYEKTDLYCPGCGDQEVWHEQGMGDFYVGTIFLCASCKADWTMQGPDSTVDGLKAQRIAALPPR